MTNCARSAPASPRSAEPRVSEVTRSLAVLIYDRPVNRASLVGPWTAVSLSLAACDHSSVRDDLRGDRRPATQCRWSGEQMLSAGVTLASSAAGPAVVAFTGRVVPLETMVRASDGGRHRVSVRVDGFAISGWLSRNELRLRARRPIALARAHVVIERGSAVIVDSASGALSARARFSPISTSAGLQCDEIEVGEIQHPRRETLVDPVHVRRPRVDVYAGASGGPVGVLETQGRIATLSRLETSGGRTRVRAIGAVSVDGWLDNASVEEGEGPDCDDCDDYGIADTLDTCDNPDAESGCPDPPRIETWTAAQARVTIAPDEGAPSVGQIERGARFFVRERREDGWLSISPARFAFSPLAGRRLWVRRIHAAQ
jgi:hypothetical protein